jgi:peptidoglycan/LPS O-acetylase OafA/YrhL
VRRDGQTRDGADAHAPPARAGESASDEGGRFIAGDPLRGVAALSVAAYHVGFFTAVHRGETSLDSYGLVSLYSAFPGHAIAHLHLGLYIFFVLSGYLIARPFVRAVVSGAAMPATLPYLRNRVLRIVPAFWLVLTVLLLAHGTLGASPAETGVTYAMLIGLEANPLDPLIGQSWTLGVEMGFYLMLPVLFLGLAAVTPAPGRHGSRLRLLVVILGCLAGAALSLYVASRRATDIQWQRTLPAALFAFAPGVLLAAIEIPGRRSAVARAVGRRALAPTLGVLGIAALVVSTRLDLDEVVARGVLAAAGTGALVAAPLVHQWVTGGCWRFLDNRAMHWFGRRSYSFYLVHVGVIYSARPLAREPADITVAMSIMLLVALPLSVLAAAISYRFFEVPFLRWRARWRPASQPVR